jgi:hypothetical protein
MPMTRSKVLSAGVAFSLAMAAGAFEFAGYAQPDTPSQKSVVTVARQISSMIVAEPYDPVRHRAFATSISSALTDAAPYAVVVKNDSTRWIEGLRTRWTITEATGKIKTITQNTDSYSSPSRSAIIAPNDELLVTPAGQLGPDLGTSFWSFALPAPPLLQRLRTAIRIEMSVDAAILDDGQALGIDGSALQTQIIEQKLAQRQMAARIRSWQRSGENVQERVSAIGSDQAESREMRRLADSVFSRLTSEPSSVDSLLLTFEDSRPLPAWLQP